MADVYTRQTECFSDERAQIAALHERARLRELHNLVDVADVVDTYRAISDNDPRDIQALLRLDTIVRSHRNDAVHATALKRLIDLTHDKNARCDYLLDLAAILEGVSLTQAQESYRAALDEVPSCPLRLFAV